MRILSAVIPAFLGLMLPSVSQADWPGFPFVYAQGEAGIEVPPETATIMVNVVSFHEESTAALETLQAQIGKVLDLLEAAGIPADRIAAHNLYKDVVRARNEEHDRLEILGYEFARRFEVQLTDLNKFSAVIAELSAVDNVVAVNSWFEVENRDEIDSRLVREAGEDARRRAEDMARSMGVTTGSVFAISERPIEDVGSAFGLPGDSYRVAGSAPHSRARQTFFVPETISFSATVNVLFTLQEK